MQAKPPEKDEPRQTIRVTMALAAIIGEHPQKAARVGASLEGVRRGLAEKTEANSARRGHVVAVAVEAAVRAKLALGSPVTCKTGCAACCRMLVQVSPSEAVFLVGAACASGVHIPVETLKRHAEALAAMPSGTDAADAWWALPDAQKRCAFLAIDETCTVYDWRPSACRKYMVTGNARGCASLDKREPIRAIVAAEAEIVASALIDLEGVEALPVAVLRAVEAYDKGVSK